ncbi:hypothetical protein GGX14DRAFT_407412 [Mycena pura]|uniref:Uncharacterized protein n=1 Tax=Mycena pura TaxID=153505 RepID=A0AAD6Y282_9AGAR|nr:hypothetical protein GGX14DRAFT_407412 [Mycena pura]
MRSFSQLVALAAVALAALAAAAPVAAPNKSLPAILDELRTNLKNRSPLPLMVVASLWAIGTMARAFATPIQMERRAMYYDIDAGWNLLEDMEVDEQDVGIDAMGNPIEKGGRPWRNCASNRSANVVAALNLKAAGADSFNFLIEIFSTSFQPQFDTQNANRISHSGWTSIGSQASGDRPCTNELESANTVPEEINPTTLRRLDEVEDVLDFETTVVHHDDQAQSGQATAGQGLEIGNFRLP